MDTIELLSSLTELQRLSRAHGTLTTNQRITVARIRREAPAAVLSHFDDLVKRDCKAVVQVHNGVCSGCYLKLPTSLFPSAEEELLVCETCGAYLSFESEVSSRGLSVVSG